MMATLQGNSAGDRRITGNWACHRIALANAGAHVLVHFGRSPGCGIPCRWHSLKRRTRECDQSGLGTPEGPTLLAKEVRSIVGERLDVLVSNAGISKVGTIKDHTAEEF